MTCLLCQGTGYARINSVGLGGSTPCLKCQTGRNIAYPPPKRQRARKRAKRPIVASGKERAAGS
jgi:hypothetical protein